MKNLSILTRCGLGLALWLSAVCAGFADPPEKQADLPVAHEEDASAGAADLSSGSGAGAAGATTTSPSKRPAYATLLKEATAIPSDCQVLILAGPREPYGPAVEAAIERYVDGGGRLALLLDPPKGAPVLAQLLARYGVALAKPKRELPIAQLEIDRSLDFARGWTQEALVLLTATALTVTLKEGAPWQVHCVAREFSAEPGTTAACFIAAVRPAAGAKGSKLLVAGDVDAFSNQSLVGLPGSLFGKPGKLFQLPGNIELFAQAIAWLAE